VLEDPPVGDRYFRTTEENLGDAVLSVGPPDHPATDDARG
jgi:hypothetical protein